MFHAAVGRTASVSQGTIDKVSFVGASRGIIFGLVCFSGIRTPVVALVLVHGWQCLAGSKNQDAGRSCRLSAALSLYAFEQPANAISA